MPQRSRGVAAGADQFRPGPPPALDSERYRVDLAEVRAFGVLNSQVRTAAQTETARLTRIHSGHLCTNTPAHPDYPSGHNTYAGAAEQVLTAFTGAARYGLSRFGVLLR